MSDLIQWLLAGRKRLTDPAGTADDPAERPADGGKRGGIRSRVGGGRRSVGAGEGAVPGRQGSGDGGRAGAGRSGARRTSAAGADPPIDAPAAGSSARSGRAATRVVPTGARARLRGEVAEAAAIVERTLAELGAPGHVVAATVGPTITRLGVAPAVVERYDSDGTLRRRERVRVAQIIARASDLALALGARSLRVEAPVPGQPYVGLEIPNRESAPVALSSLLAERAFRAFESAAALPFVLGRDVAGRPVLADLARLPHLLVAGSTGSGKSVALNSLLAALLGRRKPEELRVLVLDPKRVEFGWLEGVAHLLAPVVVDPEAAVEVLGKLETEMARRYDLLARAGVRDLAGYNAAATPAMPRLLLVVDELADLMMLAPEDVEHSVCRLAQLGRAAGVHIVVATQRPSVDVLTGLIKANLPARLAFATASQIDSRTILDASGAELLLGRGDFLYLPPDAPRAIRGQGARVADDDLARLAKRCRRKRGQRDTYAEEFASLQTAAARAAAELLQRARDLAAAHERVSASFLQRKLRIGYAKARDLLDLLRSEGLATEDDEDEG